MNTISSETSNGHRVESEPEAGAGSAVLTSPFAQHELADVSSGPQPDFELAVSLESPFMDSYVIGDSEALESEAIQMLLAELEDEEFTEALEALAEEAAAKCMRGSAGWDSEVGAPVFDPTEAEQWMESIADRADGLLADLENHFADRSVESVTEEELDLAMEAAFPEMEAFADPLGARELFFGKLKKKLKKVANAAKNVVKKGIKAVSKVVPLGLIFKRLRPLIRPLLKKVLASAIGKLPRSLQGPARKLAAKYGLPVSREFDADPEVLAEEFDLFAAESMSATDDSIFEAEAVAVEADLAQQPNVVQDLDKARERLVQEILDADGGEPPVAAMEQFIPLAILPIIKTGISLIGRKRVINFVAGLLARLIQPVVGRQLAKPLAVQIADKGLGLLNLEAEATASGRLGAEALVAAVEDTVGEVFSMSAEMLDSELVLEAAVQDSFDRAAARHIPGEFLRGELVDAETEASDGVWVLGPRATSPLYRYKKYSKALPARVTKAMAKRVVFSDGETLEERLADEGISEFPVDVEVEAFELLPGSNLGHVTSFETDGTDGPAFEASYEFDALEEAGELPLPADMERSARKGRGPRRKKMVRVKARGRRLKRKSPVSIRLDVSRSQPSLRLHLWLGERRAQKMSEHLQGQKHREVVSALQSMTGDPMRQVVAKRLTRMFAKRKVTLAEGAVSALANQLFDGLVATVGKQLPSLAPTVSSAAKDPAKGLTITAAYTFASLDAIGKGEPQGPNLEVRPGRHRD